VFEVAVRHLDLRKRSLGSAIIGASRDDCRNCQKMRDLNSSSLVRMSVTASQFYGDGLELTEADAAQDSRQMQKCIQKVSLVGLDCQRM